MLLLRHGHVQTFKCHLGKRLGIRFFSFLFSWIKRGSLVWTHQPHATWRQWVIPCVPFELDGTIIMGTTHSLKYYSNCTTLAKYYVKRYRTPTTKPHSMVVGIQLLDANIVNSKYYGEIVHSVDDVYNGCWYSAWCWDSELVIVCSMLLKLILGPFFFIWNFKYKT